MKSCIVPTVKYNSKRIILFELQEIFKKLYSINYLDLSLKFFKNKIFRKLFIRVKFINLNYLYRYFELQTDDYAKIQKSVRLENYILRSYMVLETFYKIT